MHTAVGVVGEVGFQEFRARDLQADFVGADMVEGELSELSADLRVVNSAESRDNRVALGDSADLFVATGELHSVATAPWFEMLVRGDDGGFIGAGSEDGELPFEPVVRRAPVFRQSGVPDAHCRFWLVRADGSMGGDERERIVGLLNSTGDNLRRCFQLERDHGHGFGRFDTGSINDENRCFCGGIYELAECEFGFRIGKGGH